MEKRLGKIFSILHISEISYIAKELKKYNINFGQHVILLCLFDGDNIKQEDLVKKICIDRGNIARSVKGLEENGYIIKTADKDDKRAYRIQLTQKGNSIKSIILNVEEKWNKALIGNLDLKEVEFLYVILNKLLENKNYNNS